MTEKELREMKLHEEIGINSKLSWVFVRRVINGWIYTEYLSDSDNKPISSVFVPDTTQQSEMISKMIELLQNILESEK